MNQKEVNKKMELITTLLDETGELTLIQLCRLLNDQSIFVMLALGCLIEKRKISMYEEGFDFVIKPNYSISNLYY